jgi:hypothetical protein
MGNTLTKKEQIFHNNILLKIHDEIYIKMNQNYIDVFLCGGASSKKKTSVRDKIREGLKKFENIRVLYPEDLFIEMLSSKNQEYDLLSLERFLADNCDIICIVCESPGSLVELGAFTNNDNTVNKVIALIEEKRKRQKSFIMLGPVKILRHISKERVIFYNEELEGINEKLRKTFEKKLIQSKDIHLGTYKPINSLLGLYYFIPLIIYFFKKIEMDVLKASLKTLFTEKGYETEDFDTLFRPSLKLLYKDKFISKNIVDDKIVYILTEKGNKMVNNLLSKTDIKEKNTLYDRIRFGIIRNDYYRSF